MGFTVLDDAQGAEIVLRYDGELVAETGSAFAMMGGMPTDAGRGEVSIVRDGVSRVVMVFEDVKNVSFGEAPRNEFCENLRRRGQGRFSRNPLIEARMSLVVYATMRDTKRLGHRAPSTACSSTACRSSRSRQLTDPVRAHRTTTGSRSAHQRSPRAARPRA